MLIFATFETVIQQQQTHIQQQQVQILQLQSRVSDLEARLAKDSSNGGKPPSGDGLNRKPKSLRGKLDRKPGDQQGRVGKGLSQVENPDLIVTHAPTNCQGCGSNLNGIAGSCVESRQVFERG